MKKLLALSLVSLTLGLTANANASSEAYCKQQYDYAIQSYGIAQSQGNTDQAMLRQAKRQGAKNFICKCNNYHDKYASNIVDATGRNFLKGTHFIGQKKLKDIVCK